MRRIFCATLILSLSGAYLFSKRDQGIALLDPEMTQDPLVMHGFHIMQQTRKYAPDYVQAHINCNSCHFDGGNNLGGQRNGIPLVGVAQKYPVKGVSLETRVSLCFERSLNGRALPDKSLEMQSLIAYLSWISKPTLLLTDRPWLGYKPLQVHTTANAEKGQTLYAKKCADCHGKRGEGTIERAGDSIPPLWGPYAFNDGAGMAKSDVFAWFIYWNMPANNPDLTEQEALDISAFVETQSRPKFILKK